MRPTASNIRRTACLTAACVLFGAAPALSGPLDPPPGSPTSTFKTLDEVEPRVPLTQENAPGDADSVFVISEPGAYYLTDDVDAGAGFEGVEIASDKVTLDLNGFTIEGDAGSRSGVAAAGVRFNIVVRNGAIRGFDESGVRLGDDFACVVEDLIVSDCGDTGISVGNVSRVRDCTSRDNGSAGVTAESRCVISRVVSEGNGSSGVSLGGRNVVRDCVSSNNAGSGFFGDILNRFESSIAENNANSGFRASTSSAAINCATRDNGDDGYAFGDNATLSNSSSRFDNGDGFDINTDSTLVNCVSTGAESNAYLLQDNMVLENCVARAAGADGFSGDNRVTLRSCVSEENAGYGVFLGGMATLVDVTSRGNIVGNALVSDDASVSNSMFKGLSSNGAPDPGTGRGLETGLRARITNCTASFNGDDGFALGSGSKLEGSIASRNLGQGVSSQAATDILIRDCLIRDNVFSGVIISSGTVIDSRFDDNQGEALIISSGMVRGCSFENSGCGIRQSGPVDTDEGVLIQGNSFVDLGFAVDLDGGGNTIIGNAAVNCANGYSANVAFDSLGPIITGAGVVTSTNPWANFDK